MLLNYHKFWKIIQSSIDQDLSLNLADRFNLFSIASTQIASTNCVNSIASTHADRPVGGGRTEDSNGLSQWLRYSLVEANPFD